MSSNVTDQEQDRWLPQQINDLWAAIREMRTLQQIGLDSINVVAYPLDGYMLIDDTVPTGGVVSYNTQVLPDPKILTNWDIYWSVYVDLPVYNVLDDTYLYPYGSALSAGQKKLRMREHWDWAKSSDAFATRYFLHEVENYDTASHHYTVILRIYGPKGIDTVT